MKRILQRFLLMLVTLVVTSMVVFIIIQLPPGDYADRYAYKLEAEGTPVSEEDIAALRTQFGLDRPMYEQYWKWISNIIFHGEWGYSVTWRQPVAGMIQQRIGYTLLLVGMTVVIAYGVAIPIGIYSAVKQYSVGDYAITAVSYAGMATPDFLLALVLLYASVRFTDASVGSLFSPEYVDAAWSWARLGDLISHLWIPAIVLGMSRIASLVRMMRALMLDELNKLYVTTARAKGLSEWRLLLKYPARVAVTPILSTLGWELARVISGAPIVSLVLALPDTGPLYLNGLLDEDVYLVAGMLLIYTVLTMVGTAISDMLLALMDPRVRQGETA